MLDAERESVQPGWSVWSSDGKELGKVIAVEGTQIRIKKSGFLGGELMLDKASVSDVETGRVELDLTASEAESAKR